MKKGEIESGKYIRWFSELSKSDVGQVGGKAANLGEMFNIKMPVPPGFAIVADAYKYFLERTGLDVRIYSILSKINVDDTAQLEKAAREIQEMIIKSDLPRDLENEITEAYETLSVDRKMLQNASAQVLAILKKPEPVFVAVRSSATAEDSSAASFAGQQETFLNVKGNIQLINSVKKCIASLFTARSIYYRIKKGFEHETVLIAEVVQIMIDSVKSGVIFSKDPVGKHQNVVVEAVWGLGEGIVSGRVQPDHYVVDSNMKILEKKIAEKKVAIVRDSGGNTNIVKLTEERANQQVLSEYEIKKLADYALKLEEHYKLPQDIEFAIDTQDIYIVQTRPITTLGNDKKTEEVNGKEILTGLGASPGIGSGEVKIVHSLADLVKIKKGDILVTEMTNPDMVISMQKAAAIITDEGGVTSHAAIVSREMGIPAVVGTKKATKILKDGEYLTVDGFKGIVYEGKLETLKAMKVVIRPVVNTQTKIKVIVDLPSFAERGAETKASAVGLMRLEGVIAESGKHPYGFLTNGHIEKYEDIIFKGISKISEHFKEVWVRTSDIRSDEFKNLEGAPGIVELNPMLGMHGIRMSLKHPDLLKAEILAMKRVASLGKTIIGIMMPQIISADEVKAVKEMIDKLEAHNLKLGVMVETPAAVQVIEELCQEGIKFISFGTNDLTQFTLAIDRGNEDVQYLYNELNPAVLRQIAHVISVCKKYGVETSICGQAGSNKDMVEFLVKHGIDSVSCNADKAGEISEFVRDMEQKGLRGIEAKSVNKNLELAKENFKEESEHKKMHKTICANCHKETEVPFVPDGKRPVYCKECYPKMKNKNIQVNPIKENPLKEHKKEEIKEEQEEFPTTEIEIDVFSQHGIYKSNLQEEIGEKAPVSIEEVIEEIKQEGLEEEKNSAILDIF